MFGTSIIKISKKLLLKFLESSFLSFSARIERYKKSIPPTNLYSSARDLPISAHFCARNDRQLLIIYPTPQRGSSLSFIANIT